MMTNHASFFDVASSFNPKRSDDHTLIFDAHTGKLLEQRKSSRNFFSYIVLLHVEMFAGLPGELLLGCMALLFVIAFLSGAIVYGPFMRRLDFGTVRKNARHRVRWFDLHNLIGIVTLTWGVVVGMTGAMNTLSGHCSMYGVRRQYPRLLASYRGKPLPHHMTSIDAAVQSTKTALPNMEVTSVVFPNNVFGSPRHYLVWTHGKTPVTSQLFTPV